MRPTLGDMTTRRHSPIRARSARAQSWHERDHRCATADGCPRRATQAVRTSVLPLARDGAGCPTVNAAMAATLRATLKSDGAAGAGHDNYEIQEA